MKKIKPLDIQNILNRERATVSRYLTGKRAITLTDALTVSRELEVPVEIFTDPKVQFEYFGKSYRIESVTSKEQKEQSHKEKEAV